MSKYIYTFFIVLLSLSVTAQNISIDNSSVKARRRGYYNWTVFVNADERTINTIDHVEYLLHPTFRHPLVKVNTPRNRFGFTATGWGEFEIKATLYFKDRTKPPINLVHWLNFEQVKI